MKLQLKMNPWVQTSEEGEEDSSYSGNKKGLSEGQIKSRSSKGITIDATTDEGIAELVRAGLPVVVG